MRILTGLALGVTASWAWRRYAGTLLWWIFTTDTRGR